MYGIYIVGAHMLMHENGIQCMPMTLHQSLLVPSCKWASRFIVKWDVQVSYRMHKQMNSTALTLDTVHILMISSCKGYTAVSTAQEGNGTLRIMINDKMIHRRAEDRVINYLIKSYK